MHRLLLILGFAAAASSACSELPRPVASQETGLREHYDARTVATRDVGDDTSASDAAEVVEVMNPCFGDFVLRSAADVAGFAALDCRTLDGNLTLDDSDGSGFPLAGLEYLEVITGTLILYLRVSAVTELSSLRAVGALWLPAGASIRTLDLSIEEIGGRVEFEGARVLDISSLMSSLTRVAGPVRIAVGWTPQCVLDRWEEVLRDRGYREIFEARGCVDCDYRCVEADVDCDGITEPAPEPCTSGEVCEFHLNDGLVCR